MANKKAKRKTKRAYVFRGNQHVNSAGQKKDEGREINIAGNGPKVRLSEENNSSTQRNDFTSDEVNFNLIINFSILSILKSMLEHTSRCPKCSEHVF